MHYSADVYSLVSRYVKAYGDDVDRETYQRLTSGWNEYDVVNEFADLVIYDADSRKRYVYGFQEFMLHFRGLFEDVHALYARILLPPCSFVPFLDPSQMLTPEQTSQLQLTRISSRLEDLSHLEEVFNNRICMMHSKDAHGSFTLCYVWDVAIAQTDTESTGKTLPRVILTFVRLTPRENVRKNDDGTHLRMIDYSDVYLQTITRYEKIPREYIGEFDLGIVMMNHVCKRHGSALPFVVNLQSIPFS